MPRWWWWNSKDRNNAPVLFSASSAEILSTHHLLKIDLSYIHSGSWVTQRWFERRPSTVSAMFFICEREQPRLGIMWPRTRSSFIIKEMLLWVVHDGCGSLFLGQSRRSQQHFWDCWDDVRTQSSPYRPFITNLFSTAVSCVFSWNLQQVLAGCYLTVVQTSLLMYTLCDNSSASKIADLNADLD